MHTTTVVIGAGRVGQTVAARLEGSLLVHGRDQPDLDTAERVLLAVPDGAIAEVCTRIAARLPAGCAVVHFSGATSVHALDAAPGPAACVHPLQTIWPDRGPRQLEGAYAAVTGDAATGERLARELGMTPFPLADEAKPVYHAATAFASNYLVTLTHVAAGLMRWPRGRPPAPSPAATPAPSRRIWPCSAPAWQSSTGRWGGPRCRLCRHPPPRP